MLGASPTSPERGQECSKRLLFHREQHSERAVTEDTLEMEAEGSGCSSEDYGRLEATIRMDSLRGHRLIVLVASTLQECCMDIRSLRRLVKKCLRGKR